MNSSTVIRVIYVICKDPKTNKTWHETLFFDHIIRITEMDDGNAAVILDDGDIRYINERYKAVEDKIRKFPLE